MDLLLRRRAMMAGMPKPYDAEVEYLESDGLSYIDTGINLRQITTAEYAIAFSQIPTGNNVVYGIYFDNTNTNHNQGPFLSNGTWRNYYPAYNYEFTHSTIDPSVATPTVGSIYSFVCVQKITYARDETMYFFARNNDHSQYLPAKYLRAFYFKISIGGVYVRDMIPVRVGSVGYMYDRISGQLFGNIGSGTFVVGPDK